jgi:hypothetical protein
VTKHQNLEGIRDTQTDVPSGIPEGARCVQRLDDSLDSAIHTSYRISLRSSSMWEPRDPLLKVMSSFASHEGASSFLVSKTVRLNR